MLPVLLAKILWAKLLGGRSSLFFIDNDAAKCSLISAYSSNVFVAKLLSATAGLDSSSGSLSWYDRVPTTSNPADAPSRGERPSPLPGLPHPIQTDVANTFTDIMASLSSSSSTSPSSSSGAPPSSS